MLARSRLNSKEKKITKALINSEISHEDFMTIVNKEIEELKKVKKQTLMELLKTMKVFTTV